MPTTDPRWSPPQQLTPIDRLFLPLLKDERDLIFVRVSALISAVLFPIVTVVFLLEPFQVALVAVPYIGFTFLMFGGRYGLMLHATGHRPIFKREYRWMQHYIPFVLGPLLGHTPTSFEAHHMMMHHVENNMLGDQSTTLPYRRDHFPHFLHYWFRFFALSYLHIGRYLWLRGKLKTFARLMGGELVWLAMVTVAWQLNWAATTLVFIVPMLMMRWLMMAGNWAQHAFIDFQDPDSGWHNSTCLTNTRYNHKCYNDGYHIVHHLKPALHWSEMAQWYDDRHDEFRERDALVFDGIADNQMIWFLLMFKRYDKLANHVVNLRERSHEELVEMLKERVRTQQGPIPALLRWESREHMVANSRANVAA